MFGLAVAIYALVILGFLVLSFFAIYQLWQFGYEGDASQRAVIIYTAVSLLVILVSVIAFFLVVR